MMIVENPAKGFAIANGIEMKSSNFVASELCAK